ncbi:MAG: hypothetical protein QXL77_06530 [Candidatus Bathyarchaeia archaeon]
MNAFKIVAYNLSALVDESSRVRKIFVDLDGYEPLDIVFNRDHWRVRGSASVERIFDIGDVNPLFQISFKSGGSCRVIWNFEAEFYGIVLVDRNVVKVEEGYRVYVPIYFHYDMVKRRCKRKITIDFKGKGECIFQLHIHRNFNHANGFSGIVILTAAGTPCHYKLPLVLLTMGLVPKPLTKDYRLLHKYFTPIIVIGENSATTHTDAIESLEFVLEIAPINVVVVPEEFLNSLVLQCPKLRTKKIVSYKADGDPYKEALNVYRLIFGSSPTIEGIVKASNVKEWFETATYAYLKNLEVVDGTYELRDPHQITNETLFNLRLKLEKRILKSKDKPLSNVYPITKYLNKLSQEISEDILGLLSPKEVYREAINMLFRPKLVTITILDESSLQAALVAAAYAISRNSPVITLATLSYEDKAKIEKMLDDIAEIYQRPLIYEDTYLSLIKKWLLSIKRGTVDVPIKTKEEIVESLSYLVTLMREQEEVFVLLNTISTLLEKYLDPESVKGYVYISLFAEPQALYELLLPYRGVGRLSGIKPTDSIKASTSSTLALINPPLKFNATLIGIGDPKDPKLDLILTSMPIILGSTIQRRCNKNVYINDIYTKPLTKEALKLIPTQHASNKEKFKLIKAFDKGIVINALKNYKLLFIFTHGGKDHNGYYIKTGRFEKLRDTEILKFRLWENRPFIFIGSCESGRALLTTNIGVTTALVSMGATVVAPLIPTNIKLALKLAENCIFSLLAGFGVHVAKLISYTITPRLENLFYVFYGDPTYNLRPIIIPNIELFEIQRPIEFLRESLVNLYREFEACLIKNDKRLHIGSSRWLKRYKANCQEDKAEELLEKASFLFYFLIAKWKKLGKIESQKIINRILTFCNEVEKHSSSNRKLLLRAKALAIECASFEKIIAYAYLKDHSILPKINELLSQALDYYTKLVKTFKHDELGAYHYVTQLRKILSLYSLFLSIEAMLMELPEKTGDALLTVYVMSPKKSDFIKPLIEILYKAATAYSIALKRNKKDKRLELKFLITHLLFQHHLLLYWFCSKKNSIRQLKTIREYAFYFDDDIIISTEALLCLKKLIDKNKSITIKYKELKLKYDPLNQRLIHLIESCKNATGVHTFVAYLIIALLFLKVLNVSSLSEFQNSESPSDLIFNICRNHGLSLDFITFSSDLIDKWILAMFNFDEFKEFIYNFQALNN